MTAARQLRLAQRALRTVAAHLANAYIGGLAPAIVREEAYTLCQYCHRTALKLNSAIQAAQAADSERRRAQRAAQRRAA